MRSVRILSTVLLSFVLFSAASFGQGIPADKLKNELVGSWLVTVEDEARTRTLIVTNVTQKTDDVLTLDGEYGYSDGWKRGVKPELRRVNQAYELAFVSGAGNKIVAVEIKKGLFEGTISYPGSEKKLFIESEAYVKDQKEGTPVVEKPSADVPASCASFSGGWTGTWPRSGQVWLWVVSVDAKCIARYTYSHSRNPKFFKTGEIKDGVLVAPVSIGTNSFRINGNQIVDRFVGSGVDDTLAFDPVDSKGIAIVDLKAREKAAQIAKPSADVPASCASFSGKWTGVWGYGVGQQWLTVASIDAKCVAKIAYRGNSGLPTGYDDVQINDGVLSFVCDRASGDRCAFKSNGDELVAVASGAAGANNNAVFKRTTDRLN